MSYSIADWIADDRTQRQAEYKAGHSTNDRRYRLEGDRISVNHEGCLECGSCRIACPHLNIEWRFPKGGYGISHKFG